MALVRIVHPEAGEAEVPESAVSHWRSSGWEVAEMPPAKERDEPGEPGSQDSKPSGRPRRRTNEESE